MPRLAWFALVVATLVGAPFAHADSAPLVGMFWQPSDTPRETAIAFAREITKRAGKMAPLAVAAVVADPSLAANASLTTGIAHYRAFRFADAVRELNALERTVESSGGAGLEAGKLAELYLYRGLARLETNDADAAWTDLVRAARIDPARTLDPQLFTPHVLSVFRRAVAEVAQQPRGEVELRVPTGASVVVEGHTLSGTAALTLGRHVARVEAPGYLLWNGTLTVNGGHEIFAPPLRPEAPPVVDDLVERLHADGVTTGVLLYGSLRRSASATADWRVSLRAVDLGSGAVRGEEVKLDDAPAAALGEAVHRLLDPPPPLIVQAPNPTTPTPPPSPPPRKSRAWIWGLVGGTGAALTIAITLGVVYGRGSSRGYVGGKVDSLR